jgi:hypothetical protein
MSPVAISGVDKQGVAVNGVQVKQSLSPANEIVSKGVYNATTLSAVDADLRADFIKWGVTIFGFLGTMTQWIYDLWGLTGEPPVLIIPHPSILPPDVVEDHSGGGFTIPPDLPDLVIPAPPALSLSELALIDKRYDLGDDGDFSIEGLFWEAQTFTTNLAHNIEIIEILCRRVLNPGNITISIRATVAGLPVLPDLTSVTFDGNALSAANAWITRYVPTQALLAATKYAIVISAPVGDAANYLVWRKDGTVPTFAGGARCSSAGGGADGTWVEDVNTDFMFREGEVI